MISDVGLCPLDGQVLEQAHVQADGVTAAAQFAPLHRQFAHVLHRQPHRHDGASPHEERVKS